MILIGEKLNGFLPSVADAIANRNQEEIMRLARIQTEAGAAYLDCCVSAKAEEVEALRWLVTCVQEATKVPVCLDSASADVLAEVYTCLKHPGIFNSVSEEGDKAERIFHIMAQEQGKDWGVIALLMDGSGIPGSAEERLRVLDTLMEKAKYYGISPERMYIDPMVEMLCTSEDGMKMTTQVIREIRRKWPKLHITAAVSNASYHLPERKLINRAFAVLAMEAGLDSLILDPTDKELIGLVYAAEALLGRDEYCLEYIAAYRSGCFGDIK